MRGDIALYVERRMNYFVVGLSNSRRRPVYKQYHYVQYDSVLPAGATGMVSFPPSPVLYRYVIVQQKYDTADHMCIPDVKVFLRGTRATSY